MTRNNPQMLSELVLWAGMGRARNSKRNAATAQRRSHGEARGGLTESRGPAPRTFPPEETVPRARHETRREKATKSEVAYTARSETLPGLVSVKKSKLLKSIPRPNIHTFFLSCLTNLSDFVHNIHTWKKEKPGHS